MFVCDLLIYGLAHRAAMNNPPLLNFWRYFTLIQHSRRYCTTGPSAHTPMTQPSTVLLLVAGSSYREAECAVFKKKKKGIHTNIPDMWVCSGHAWSFDNEAHSEKSPEIENRAGASTEY